MGGWGEFDHPVRFFEIDQARLIAPWCNWQHACLWNRRVLVRAQEGQLNDFREGWPSGLRRRPAKALGRKALVGSNPTPSVYCVRTGGRVA
jgi:hypothetical protein